MKSADSAPAFSRTGTRFVFGALMAVAVLVAFILSIHLF
jgi:hypothetical protein